jgi:hypothetical protein
MKNLIVLAVAGLFATNAFAAEMKWSGDVNFRWLNETQNDGLSSVDNTTSNKDVSTQHTKAYQARASLGVHGGWEHVEYGIALRTTGSGANSDWASFQNNGNAGVGFEQAYVRYLHDFGSVDLGVTVGRQMNALVTDKVWATLYDPTVRWDGFGWNVKFGQFGLNASQYVLGSHKNNGGIGSTSTQGTSAYSFTESGQNSTANHQSFSFQYAFQPYMNWKFADEIEALFALSYIKYVNEGTVNTAAGADASGWNSGTIPAKAAAKYKMDNNSQWDFLTTWSLPYSLNFTGEYLTANSVPYSNVSLTNYSGGWSAAPTVTKAAWNLGLTYGKLKKAHDFTLGYAYGSKGIASMYTYLTSEIFPADNRGHHIMGAYNIADNFFVAAHALWIKEKERIDPSTGLAYSGNNAGQKLATRWYVLAAGVSF